MRVRNEMYNEAVNHINEYPDISIETEEGPISLREYIHKIIDNGFYGGELEISIAS